MNKPKFGLVEWYNENIDYKSFGREGTYFRPPLNQSFVCVFGNPTNGLFKISTTDETSANEQELWMFLGLQLHTEYDEPANYVIKMIQLFFEEKRKSGEWFSLSVKDLLQIRSLFYSIEGEDLQDNLDCLKSFYEYMKVMELV